MVDVGLEPTTQKTHGLSATPFVMEISGALVRLTTCQRLINILPKLSLITFVQCLLLLLLYVVFTPPPARPLAFWPFTVRHTRSLCYVCCPAALPSLRGAVWAM